MTGQAKSGATTLTPLSKSAVTMSGLAVDRSLTLLLTQAGDFLLTQAGEGLATTAISGFEPLAKS
jgi:hypothetical protein